MKANHLPDRTPLNIRFMTPLRFIFVPKHFRQKFAPNVGRKLTLNCEGNKIGEFWKNFGKNFFEKSNKPKLDRKWT
jgi:arginine/ornithine N-succinyltransferase beta subunit